MVGHLKVFIESLCIGQPTKCMISAYIITLCAGGDNEAAIGAGGHALL